MCIKYTTDILFKQHAQIACVCEEPCVPLISKVYKYIIDKLQNHYYKRCFKMRSRYITN